MVNTDAFYLSTGVFQPIHLPDILKCHMKYFPQHGTFTHHQICCVFLYLIARHVELFKTEHTGQ